MRITLDGGLSFEVKFDDGNLKVYPTPISPEQLSEVKDKAIHEYRTRLDSLEAIAAIEADARHSLVAIAVDNFMEQICRIRRDERTPDGTPYSFSVTFTAGSPTIEIFCKENYGVMQYRNVLKESLRITESALGYDLYGPTGWSVKHVKYTGEGDESICCDFDNGSSTVNTIREFVNSYCRI